MLVFILSVSFISPLNCFSFASAPLNFPLSSTIPRATPSISSSYFLLLSLPPTSRVKNINTGTSYTSSTVYIFLPLQEKEVNFFSFASVCLHSLSSPLSLFPLLFPFPPFSPFPSPLLPSSLPLYWVDFCILFQSFFKWHKWIHLFFKTLRKVNKLQWSLSLFLPY